MKCLRLIIILCAVILFGGSVVNAVNLGKVTGEATLSLVNNSLKMNNIEFDAEFTSDGPYLKTTDSGSPLLLHGESYLLSGDQYASSWNISENNTNKLLFGTIAITWDSIFPNLPLFQSYTITGRITFTNENDNKDNLKEFTMPLNNIYVLCDGNCFLNPGSFNFSSTLYCADNVSPIITLNGSDTITIEQGQLYNELGATAVDRVGNELEVKISPDSFNTDVPVGQYFIYYDATDAKGLKTRITRTINIISNDHTSPEIRLMEPLDGDANVPIDTVICIDFKENEAMDATSITDSEDNFYVTNSQGEKIPGERTYTADIDDEGKVVMSASFKPESDLAYEETYTVHATTGIKDLNGNPLNEEYVWSFTTESQTQDVQDDDSGGGGSGCFLSTLR